MSGTCVIGLQWGDEAKGKLVDLLTDHFDIVVRYQGGANAGHTVVVGDETYKLHHIPSGILNPNVMNVVGPGVVLNPPTILQEIDSLIGRGIKVAFPVKRVNCQAIHGLACDGLNTAALKDLVDTCEPFGFGCVGKPAAQGKEIVCHDGDLV